MMSVYINMRIRILRYTRIELVKMTAVEARFNVTKFVNNVDADISCVCLKKMQSTPTTGCPLQQ